MVKSLSIQVSELGQKTVLCCCGDSEAAESTLSVQLSGEVLHHSSRCPEHLTPPSIYLTPIPAPPPNKYLSMVVQCAESAAENPRSSGIPIVESRPTLTGRR